MNKNRFNINNLPKPLPVKTQNRALMFIAKANAYLELARTSVSEEEMRVMTRRSSQIEKIILRSNLRLVHSIALPYHLGTMIEMSDLMDEGFQGLRKALEKYDISKGCAFSTYAYPWIKNYISTAIAKTSYPVSLPQHVYKLLTKVNFIRKRFNSQYGRDPTDDELSLIMDLTPARFEIVRKAFALASSRSEVQREADGKEFFRTAHYDESTWEAVEESNVEGLVHDVTSTVAVPNPNPKLIQSEAMTSVLHMIDTLPLAESQALLSRFGLDPVDAETTETEFKIQNNENVVINHYERGIRKLRRRLSSADRASLLHEAGFFEYNIIAPSI